MTIDEAVLQARNLIHKALQDEKVPLSSKGIDFIEACVRDAILNARKSDWYQPDEFRHALKRQGYAAQFADDLTAMYAENLNAAHRKGRQHGMQRAVQLITPTNPMSRSSYAQGRNECCRIIRDAMEKET